MPPIERELRWLLEGILGLLVVATFVGWFLKKRVQGAAGAATVANLNGRIRAWWAMSLVFALMLVVGRVGSLVLFTLMSFLALREFITLTPTRRGDHRALFWTFFVVTPLQYLLIATLKRA